MELESFELVLLHTPEAAPDYDEETLTRLQGEHLAFYARLRQQGHVVTNGPVLDQPDKSFRGLAFFRVGSVAAAKQLAETDPSVVAGRLSVTAMTWWCAPGTMVSTGQPVSTGS